MGNLRTRNHGSSVGGAIARAKLLEKMAKTPGRKAQSAPAAGTSKFVQGSVIAAAFVAGTGGLMTANYVAVRNDRGYKLPIFEYFAPKAQSPATLVRPPFESLALLKEVLRPSVTELAALFNVSRQAIYNWQAGQPIAQQNVARLESLSKAADVLKAAGISAAARPLNRKLPNGKSLLEAVQAGGNPEGLAKSLVALLEQEARQRAVLSARVGRRAERVDSSDIGIQSLDESA